ncbi:hypothetical protein NUU61_008793 [Penicillium alfredii]|uniref:Uncharacterized protein n=1 Tax=Penicillium alfredii TaxID=1506179 RepID=A0A9W9EM35_9EURO|nr:uncharacterized protein NUU61_008793 [Penicillium alfredii]KAJ5084214.1 hypothetical protein NUU61_008793 [Penicillium alfredii]
MANPSQAPTDPVTTPNAVASAELEVPPGSWATRIKSLNYVKAREGEWKTPLLCSLYALPAQRKPVIRSNMQ